MSPQSTKTANKQQLENPTVVVIFGASGDLTTRKLYPALYNLLVDQMLPEEFFIIGAARRDLPSDKFSSDLGDALKKFSRRKEINPEAAAKIKERTKYVSFSFDDENGYLKLKNELDAIDKSVGKTCTRLFYLATAPEYFEIISKHLKSSGLLDKQSTNFPRVVIEKPFGNDLLSAKKLNQELLTYMSEDQIYRIDHYLGKETVQNLLVFRFANGIFEPIWNRNFISHVEISVCESIGVENRAGYFDKAGILRDIVQNHALQLLTLIALEPPVAFDADSVRDEKVKVLRSIRRYSREDIGSKVIRARYLSGNIAGKPVVGYLGEQGVDQESTTETYACMEINIDNWRWAGVPFFLRSGKRLAKRATELSVYFKHVPHKLIQNENTKIVNQNVLSFQIQPDEGIALKINSKQPGTQVRMQSVNMDFSYGTSFGGQAPEAYERLLLDAMRGDPTLFTRDDEIEEAWAICQPIIDAWSSNEKNSPPVYGYEAGSWGPKMADEMLIKKIGRGWRRL